MSTTNVWLNVACKNIDNFGAWAKVFYKPLNFIEKGFARIKEFSERLMIVDILTFRGMKIQHLRV